MSDTREIIRLLTDGEFHSGEELGEALGISRAAIWKQIKQLEGLGIAVESVHGRGYRIGGGMSLLELTAIQRELNQSSPFSVNILDQIDSTNAECRRVLSKDRQVGNFFVLAERQKAGRGRRGRHWVSPYGQNLYLSAAWRFESGASGVAGLSLAVGVVVAECLEAFGLGDIKLKWPNDLICQDRKLGGILIELEGDPLGPCDVVVGIGLNVNMLNDQDKTIDQPWISMSEALESSVDRNALAARVIERLAELLAGFESSGLAPMLPQWDKIDYLKQKAITVHLGDQKIQGSYRGITTTGELCAEIEGELRQFSGGEISVRVKK